MDDRISAVDENAEKLTGWLDALDAAVAIMGAVVDGAADAGEDEAVAVEVAMLAVDNSPLANAADEVA